MAESKWSLIAKKLDSNRAKFDDFLGLIRRGHELNKSMFDEKRKKLLNKYLDCKNVERSKLQLKQFVDLASQHRDLSEMQITNMLV